jgi:hypothetical protein
MSIIVKGKNAKIRNCNFGDLKDLTIIVKDNGRLENIDFIWSKVTEDRPDILTKQKVNNHGNQ